MAERVLSKILGFLRRRARRKKLISALADTSQNKHFSLDSWLHLHFYSFSVDIIVLTLFGRFMHFMHVYFIQS